MATEMTKEWLLERCKAQGLYRTPQLNDSLYLQCQAFCEIQNLEEYTGVKQLYLEENCLESLDGIQPLEQLQCLYLRKNFVRSIDYLERLEHLDTLDISQNCLTKLDNLSKCSKLRVLVVSHNLLDSAASIAHLALCPSIMILDLSHNKLNDGEAVLKVAKSLVNLTVLYLSGNPFVTVFPHYRKKLISTLAKVNHLDDRPVFWDERRYAEAWLRGGQEEESKERECVRETRVAEETAQFQAMRQLRCQHMEERLQMVSHPLGQFTFEEMGEEDETLNSPNKVGKSSTMMMEDQSPYSLMEEKGILQSSIVKIEVEDHPTSCSANSEQNSHSKIQKNSSADIEIRDQLVCSLETPMTPAMVRKDGTIDGLTRSKQTQSLASSFETKVDFMKLESMSAEDQSQQCLPSKYDTGVTNFEQQHLHKGGDRKQTEQSSTTPSISEESLTQVESMFLTKVNFPPTSTPSTKVGENFVLEESMIQSDQKKGSSTHPSMFQGLDSICLPSWEFGVGFKNGLSIENVWNCNNEQEVKTKEDTKHIANLEGATPLTNEFIENNPFLWERDCNNSSVCVEQYDDNFLLSLHTMNQVESSCTLDI